MQKHQQLQQLINEVNFPNLEDRLNKGSQFLNYQLIFKGDGTDEQPDFYSWVDCEIVDTYGGGQIADTGDFSEYCIIAAMHNGFGCEYKNVHEEIDFEDSETVNILGYPISLELIIAALEKKDMGYISYCANKNEITFSKTWQSFSIPFTPLQPLPQESVEKLLEIFK